MRRSISEVIQSVLENPNNEADHLAHSLHVTIITALERAGIFTDVDPWDTVNPAIGTMLGGEALIHLESRHEPGEEYGVADLKVRGRFFLSPVVKQRESGATFEEYEVVVSGVTIPFRDDGTHLSLRTVEPE